MTVAGFIAAFLCRNGIRKVWGYQGGNIALLIDALALTPGIDFISSYNEQGAAFAANGESLYTGKPAVAIASSGPGAINLINGIANAYFDSLPVLFITGDLSRYWSKGNGNQRQRGFQDTDIVSMVSGITKFARQIQTPSEIVSLLHHSWEKMQEGRKGPVLLSIPHWVFKAEIKDVFFDVDFREKPNPGLQEITKTTIQQIADAARPAIVIGHGCCRVKQIVAALFGDKSIPIVTTLPGLDCVDRTWRNMFGFVGTFGEPWANYVVKQADFLLVLGARLDERVDIRPNANQRIVHIDLDPDEFFQQTESENYQPVRASAEAFLQELQLSQFPPLKSQDYHRRLLCARDESKSSPSVSGALKNRLEKISIAANDDAVFVIDTGFHQLAAAHALAVTGRRRILFSSGLGSMGFALPAALGVRAVEPRRQIVVVTGDGGLMMNLQELQVLKRENWQILIVVANNRALGLICAVQDAILNGRHHGSQDGYEPCGMQETARAFDMQYFVEDTPLETVFDNMHRQKTSALLELRESDIRCTIKAEFSPDEMEQINKLMENK